MANVRSSEDGIWMSRRENPPKRSSRIVIGKQVAEHSAWPGQRVRLRKTEYTRYQIRVILRWRGREITGERNSPAVQDHSSSERVAAAWAREEKSISAYAL